MIRQSYIHGMDSSFLDQEQREADRIFFNEQFELIDYYTMQRETMEMFHESADDIDLVTEGVNDALRSIGNKIIEIINRVRKFITDVIDKIKEASWKKKDDDKKLAGLIKKDPALAKRVEIAVSEGKLELNSFKDLNTFYKTIDEVMDEIERGDADPKTIKGKITKARGVLEKNAKTLKAVAGVAGSVLTIYNLYSVFKKANAANDGDIEQMRRAAETRADKYHRMAETINNQNSSDDYRNLRSKAAMKAYAVSQYEQVTNGVISNKSKAKFALMKMMDRGIAAMSHQEHDTSESQLHGTFIRERNNAQNAANGYSKRINHRSQERWSSDSGHNGGGSH